MTGLHLAAIALGGPALTTQAGFCRDAWGLVPAASLPGGAWFRGTGPAHHIVSLHDRPAPGILAIDFAADDVGAADAVRRRLVAANVPMTAMAPLAEPGGGSGFGFRDLDGRRLRVVVGRATVAPLPDVKDHPRRLSHVVVNTQRLEAVKDWYCEILGFRLSDWSEDQMAFLRCDSNHHSIALNRAGHVSLNHVAFEMAGVDGYMRGIGRMKHAGQTVDWGPGRHGPGDNPFAYFVTPLGFVFEFTCDLQQVEEATHTPQVWQRKPPFSDTWGTAGPPSPAIRAAMAGQPDPNASLETP